MTDGRLMLGIAALICAGAFLNGVRFWRMSANPFAGRTVLGQPVEGHDLPVSRIRLIGYIQMIAAPVFFLFFTALCFGLLGPVEGIRPISIR